MMFTKMPTTDFSAFAAPVQKLIELNTATFTKAFELQKATAEKQIAQTQADFKALSEIKDVEALTSFFTAKSEEAKANFEALQAEAKASVESTQSYFTEVQAILTESKDSVVPAVKAIATKTA